MPASIRDLHGQDLDWSLFDNKQWPKLLHWLTSKRQMVRSRKRYRPDAGGVDKVKSSVEDNLTRLAVDHYHLKEPDLAWFGNSAYDLADLKVVFEGFAEYMQDMRNNEDDYIAKRLRDLKPAFEWSMSQLWYWDREYQEHWRVPEAEASTASSYVNNLCVQLNHEGEKAIKRRKELRSMLEPELKLKAYQIKLASHHLKVVAAAKEELVDGDVCNETAVEVLELFVLEMLGYGGRTFEGHRLMWAGDADCAMNLLAEGNLTENDALLVRQSEVSTPKFAIMVLDAKEHFVCKPLHRQCTLIDLVHECFGMEIGQFYFSPDCHGKRPTKVKDVVKKRFFQTNLRFSEYVRIVSKRIIGIHMRPYGIRRMLATDLENSNASLEVRKSTACLMGTSDGTLRTNYEETTFLQRAALGQQRLDYQFDSRFDPKRNTYLMPLMVSMPTSSGGKQTKLHCRPARVVREVEGQKLMGLFQSIDEAGTPSKVALELGPVLYLVDSSTDIGKPIQNCLADDQGTQIWRYAEQHANDALKSFEHLGMTIAWTQTILLDPVKGEIAPMAGDFVFCYAEYAVALVKKVKANNKLEIVTLEPHKRDASKALYRFHAHGTKDHQEVCIDSVIWPIDLVYDSSLGFFELRKSGAKNMHTV